MTHFYFSSVAWLIGWALVLEYTIGGSAVARGISPNLVSVVFPSSSSMAFDQYSNYMSHIFYFHKFRSSFRPCSLEDQTVFHGFYHATSFHGLMSLLIPVPLPSFLLLLFCYVLG
jgi:amino acid transporter